jgi:hypothetical protein
MRKALLIAVAALAAALAAGVMILLRARSSQGVISAQPLETMTRDELYELARSRDIPGRSRMKKDELRSALENGR